MKVIIKIVFSVIGGFFLTYGSLVVLVILYQLIARENFGFGVGVFNIFYASFILWGIFSAFLLFVFSRRKGN